MEENIQKYSETEGAFYPEVFPEIISLDTLYTELKDLNDLATEIAEKIKNKQIRIDKLISLGVKKQEEIIEVKTEEEVTL
jgi:hypothetical protein